LIFDQDNIGNGFIDAPFNLNSNGSRVFNHIENRAPNQSRGVLEAGSFLSINHSDVLKMDWKLKRAKISGNKMKLFFVKQEISIMKYKGQLNGG
jgi:hypothetical protein